MRLFMVFLSCFPSSFLCLLRLFIFVLINVNISFENSVKRFFFATELNCKNTQKESRERHLEAEDD
jgi:hypothetical protein